MTALSINSYICLLVCKLAMRIESLLQSIRNVDELIDTPLPCHAKYAQNHTEQIVIKSIVQLYGEKMKTIILSLFIMFGLTSYANAEDALSVTPNDVWSLVQQDSDQLLFVDIRDPVEIMFVGSTDAADINIPFKLVDRTHFNEDKSIFTMNNNPDFVSDIEKALKAKGLDKDALIVTMCRSGSERGKPSADYLLTQGFTNVKYIDHGFQGSAVKEGVMKGFRTINGWQNAKLPWTSTIDSAKINKP